MKVGHILAAATVSMFMAGAAQAQSTISKSVPFNARGNTTKYVINQGPDGRYVKDTLRPAAKQATRRGFWIAARQVGSRVAAGTGAVALGASAKVVVPVVIVVGGAFVAYDLIAGE